MQPRYWWVLLLCREKKPRFEDLKLNIIHSTMVYTPSRAMLEPSSRPHFFLEATAQLYEGPLNDRD
jgi:hypothetical protein